MQCYVVSEMASNFSLIYEVTDPGFPRGDANLLYDIWYDNSLMVIPSQCRIQDFLD